MTTLAERVEAHVRSVLASRDHSHSMMLTGEEWAEIIAALRARESKP